jgi:hypothetical protein
MHRQLMRLQPRNLLFRLACKHALLAVHERLILFRVRVASDIGSCLSESGGFHRYSQIGLHVEKFGHLQAHDPVRCVVLAAQYQALAEMPRGHHEQYPQE